VEVWQAPILEMNEIRANQRDSQSGNEPGS
jgi:hypothetical protein